MYALSTLGFGPFFQRQLPSIDELVIARVASEHRGAYQVWSPAGAGRAVLAGRLRHAAAESALPGTGDWVVVDRPPGPDGTALIERVLDRRTVFTRGAAGAEARLQVVAANVDLVLVVCGLDGDYNVRRIERYLARVAASGASPVIVLNKADVCADVDARVAEVERHAPGVPVYVTSAVRDDGVAAVRALIGDGMTAALVGSSGAGKSTLVNALARQSLMTTGAVRAHDSRGRHVTTHRQLVLLPGGGLLLDTPGMRELQLVDEDGLAGVFADVERVAAGCRFRDCQHQGEPGCAVVAAVDAGELDAARLDHHRQLAREARSFELRHDQRSLRQAGRRWGKLMDEVAQLRRWKGGKP